MTETEAQLTCTPLAKAQVGRRWEMGQFRPRLEGQPPWEGLEGRDLLPLPRMCSLVGAWVVLGLCPVSEEGKETLRVS